MGGSAADKPTWPHTFFLVCTHVGFFCSVPKVHRIPDSESVPEKQLQEPRSLIVSSTFSENGASLASPTFGEAVLRPIK